MLCLREVLQLLLLCRTVFGHIVRNDDFVGDELFMAPEAERVDDVEPDDAGDGGDYAKDNISNLNAEVWV